MKLRTLLSIALNTLLLGFTIWLESLRRRSEGITEASHFPANQSLRAESQPMRSPSEINSLPDVLEIGESFHWAQLESSDYRVYLANLRAIGCPESTVRDILIADVNDLFAIRVKTLVDEVSGRFWELILRKEDLEKMVNEKQTQLQTLTDERDEVFTALFGDQHPRSVEILECQAADRRVQWERVADFLPEEKCVRFVTAKEELERAWTEYLRTPGLTDLERQAKRKDLDAAHNQSLGEWLSPDEYVELRLRQSPAASVRERLVSLNLTEEEVRSLAHIQFTKEEAQAVLSRQGADFTSQTAKLQQQSDAQTRELIGVDGYAALQRAADGRYDPIYRVAQRLDLSDYTAAQAYDIRRQAEVTTRQLRANESLHAEDRQALLQAVSAEAEQSLSATLGPKGFAAYEKIDGGWLRQLSAPRQ